MRRPHVRCRVLFAAFLLAAFALLGGCTSTKVKPSLETRPQESFQNVAIGEFTSTDELWGGRVPFLRRGVVEKLRQENAFQNVFDPAPSEIPPHTLVVSGQLTSVDKGSAAARMIVGFGAGSAKATATFQVKDAEGTELVAFAMKKSYAGGAGIGGGDLVDLDDLLQKLGEKAAESVIAWSRGKGID